MIVLSFVIDEFDIEETNYFLDQDFLRKCVGTIHPKSFVAFFGLR